MANNLRNTQKDIIPKLDIIIEQNEQIINENKLLKDQNDELIKENLVLRTKIEKSDTDMVNLNMKIDQIMEKLDKIKDNTSDIDVKIGNTSKSTNKESTCEQGLENEEPQKHGMIISPNEDVNFSQSTWREIATKKLSSVQINKVSTTKSGQCYIKFPNKQNQQKAMEVLKDEFKVTAESKIIGISPKITIYDLDSETYCANSQEKLKKDILIKNPEIKNLVDDGKTFEILFIKEKHQNGNQAVVKVDPEILNALNNLKKIRKTNAVIFIQNSACRFYNRFHILQCYQCQSFGHRKGTPSCPLASTNRNTCLYCSLNHQSKDCNLKKQPENFKCANCSRFANPDDETQNLCHTTTDQNCPMFQKQMEYVIKHTRGIASSPKNEFARHVFIT